MASVSDHSRGDGNSALVYPVISRRSGGLSVGINLFPSRKVCNFACPYCEVLPFESPREFSPEKLSEELGEFFLRRFPGSDFPVRDLCVSGNGEPTLSPWLSTALDIAAAARDRFLGGPPGGTKIVLITNGTGFANPDTAEMLSRAVRGFGLEIWTKIDAADPGWFALMSGSVMSFRETLSAIEEFAMRDPIVVQTMLCGLKRPEGAVDFVPDAARLAAFADLISGIIGRGARISDIQLYTKARPDALGLSSPLPDGVMMEAGAMLRRSVRIPVRVFGERGELPAKKPSEAHEGAAG